MALGVHFVLNGFSILWDLEPNISFQKGPPIQLFPLVTIPFSLHPLPYLSPHPLYVLRYNEPSV